MGTHVLSYTGSNERTHARTQPDSPRSPTQRYRLTHKGLLWLQLRNN
ncbi:Fic family protein [Nitrosomonas sp.]